MILKKFSIHFFTGKAKPQFILSERNELRLVNVRGYLADNPLPVVDLYPLMSAYEQEHGVQLYYADGVHWNERGHRLIADELKKVLQLIRATSSAAWETPPSLH